jgi:glycosyltransferase involved in cell wall biosynthesis
VTIFLNAERFIEEAIESVFAQTYGDWELLLVDDGSTDGSTQIALRYAERHPRKVRYLEHPGHENRGMSASRNLGIGHARGEYVAFLDADDVHFPYTLDRQVTALDARPEAGMVYGSAQYWYSWTGTPEDARRDFRDFVEERGVRPGALIEPPALLAVFLRDGGAVPCPCTVLVRREVAKSVGGFDERFEGQYEDQVFYFKVGLRAPVFAVGECWSRYRRHPDSSWLITQKTGQHLLARRFFLDWLTEYLSELRVEAPEVLGPLRHERRFVQTQIHVQKREWKQAARGMLALLRYHPRELFARVYRKLSSAPVCWSPSLRGTRRSKGPL